MGQGPSNELKGKAVTNVAVERSMYAAGEVVRGYVHISVMEPVALTCVTVRLTGTALTVVDYTTESGSGENRHTEHHTARQLVAVVALEAVVASFPPGDVAAGRYQLPFEFQLPDTAPPSVERQGGRDHCSFSYDVGVTATRPGWLKRNLVHRVAILVGGPPAAATRKPVSRTEVVDVTACCCVPKGAVTLDATAATDAVAAGDAVAVTFAMASAMKQDAVSSVQVSLQRRLHFKAHGHHHRETRTVAELSVPAVAGTTVQLGVPDVAVPSLDLATITLAYTVQVKAVTADACTGNPAVHLPVLLYRRVPGAPGGLVVAEAEAKPSVAVVVDAGLVTGLPVADVIAYEPNPGLYPHQYVPTTVPVGAPVDPAHLDDN